MDKVVFFYTCDFKYISYVRQDEHIIKNKFIDNEKTVNISLEYSIHIHCNTC
jgi:hypothetical protein